jgi:GntR family transcriptional regulator / MocR family aminotransferase
MRIQYKAIRDQLIDQIKSSWLAPYISISQENAGLHFLLDIDTDMTDEQLKEKALDMGIEVSFLSDYLSDRHVAVINYSGLGSSGVDLRL